MQKKNLIVQTQRLGDLVMSFPLCSWLYEKDGRHIWVIGEEKFYKELLRVSPPNISYLPVSGTSLFKEDDFHEVINLSHNPSTYSLVGKLQAKEKLGMFETDNVQKIHGFWQLYRASLVNNNHYNTFHWADLNAMDSISLETIRKHTWKVRSSIPSRPEASKGRIGLFVGASDISKRPDTEFWTNLALSLAKKGYEPVLLGGPSDEEQEIAGQAAKGAGMLCGSLAGRFNIFELIAFLHSLELLVTPDTGPMHLASMEGVPTFNLSMGNVHPWETGPYPPGHYVLRSSLSCGGCWQCTKKSFKCKEAFLPARVANLIHATLNGKTLPTLPKLSLYKSARDEHGLYELQNIFGDNKWRNMQNNFWRFYFLDLYFQEKQENPFALQKQKAFATLEENLPKLTQLIKKQKIRFLKEVIMLTKTKTVFDDENWKKYPPFFRPLSSFIQLYLENGEYSPQSKAAVLNMLELL